MLFRQLFDHELSGDWFFLAPVVIDVAFKAARFGGVLAGVMALPAAFDAGEQDVGCLAALIGFGVAGHAFHHLMRLVIELAVLEPTRRDPRLSDRR